MLLSLVLLSCNSTDKSQQTEQDQLVTDSAYLIFDSASVESIDIDIVYLQDFLQSQINQLRSFHTTEAFEIAQGILDEGDENCPQYYQTEEYPYWADTCSSQLGATFGGFGTLIEFVDFEDEYGNLINGQQYYGDGTLESASGETLITQGSMSLLQFFRTDGGIHHSSSVQQGFESFNSEGWLGWEFPPIFESQAIYFPGTEQRLYSGVATLETQSETLYIDQLILFSEAFGGCSEEAGAAFSYYSDATGWLDIKFQGPTFENFEVDPELCDGCGSIYQLEEYIGDVCLDFSPLLAWTDNPWN